MSDKRRLAGRAQVPGHEPGSGPGSAPGQLIAHRLADGLRRWMLAVPAVVLALNVTTLLDAESDYRPLWLEVLAFGVLAGLTVLAAVPVLRGRAWGPWRWPLLGTALGATTLATAATAPRWLIGRPHWSWELFGWWAVLLLLDRPVAYLLTVLSVHLGLTAGLVVAAGRHDVRTFVGMGTVALVLGGLQMAAWLLGAGTRRAADSAARLAAEGERLRTAEVVAEQVHRDRLDRYADLAETAGPLLTGLESGERDPGEPEFRRTCAIEAARIRRLFAESDDATDPLVHELTACTDVAARRGVVVQLAVRGQCPPLPQPLRRALTEPAIVALAGAVSVARVTVVGGTDRVVVSVVTDGSVPPSVPPVADPPGTGVHVAWARHDDTVWMEATWETAMAGTR